HGRSAVGYEPAALEQRGGQTERGSARQLACFCSLNTYFTTINASAHHFRSICRGRSICPYLYLFTYPQQRATQLKSLSLQHYFFIYPKRFLELTR
ncbi:unnamed protein product, partial [Brenthis ino]